MRAHDTAALAQRVGVVAFIGGLGGGLAFPILPALGIQFGIPGFLIGLILSANRVTRVLCNAPAGWLIDRMGGRWPLAWGLALEAAGMLCFSAGLRLGDLAWWLLGGRVLFGVGSALLFVGAQATVLGLSSPTDRGRRTATVRIALSLGMPGGLVLGGVIADLASDDAAFLTAAALSAAGALLAAWQIPAGPVGRRRERPRGGAGGRLQALLGSPEFPVLAATWGANALIFLSVQGALLATLVLRVHGLGLRLFDLGDQGTAGLVMAVMMACSSLAAFVLGRGIDRLRLRSTVVPLALLALAAGFVLLACARELWSLVLGVMVVGCAYNGVTLPMLALLGDITPQERYGRAVGWYQLFGDLGGSLGPIVGLEAGLHLGLRPTYLGLAVLIAACGAAALRLRAMERRVRRGRALQGG